MNKVNKMRITHITNAHNRDDNRIMKKMCYSLSNEGADLTLIISDGNGDSFYEGISIIDIGKNHSRSERFFKNNIKILLKALRQKSDIYHFHDPDFLIYGLILKVFSGKKVIYDVHEEYSLDILKKTYIRPLLIRKFIAVTFNFIEKSISTIFDGIVCATPKISSNFIKYNKNSITVNNYPNINETLKYDLNSPRNGNICYIGAISRERGIYELLDALYLLPKNIYLDLCGWFPEEDISSLKKHPAWQRVNFHGKLNRQEVNEVLIKSSIGICTLHPTPAYLNSLPIKMFEYMAFGLPVVVSNFPYWIEIIDKARCGTAADPLDSGDIAKKISLILESKEIYSNYSKNGISSVRNKFNWNFEARKLITFYERL